MQTGRHSSDKFVFGAFSDKVVFGNIFLAIFKYLKICLTHLFLKKTLTNWEHECFHLFVDYINNNKNKVIDILCMLVLVILGL